MVYRGPSLTIEAGDGAWVPVSRTEETKSDPVDCEIVQQQARPMRTTMTSPWYRRRVASRLARRLLMQLG